VIETIFVKTLIQEELLEKDDETDNPNMLKLMKLYIPGLSNSSNFTPSCPSLILY
jgi:hypothetical protein